jgi:hypothetical protein
MERQVLLGKGRRGCRWKIEMWKRFYEVFVGKNFG